MQKQIMKRQSMKKQQGMTVISWIIVLAFVGFQFMLAIKILPAFSEDYTIAKIWKDVENDVDLVGASPKKIKQVIRKSMRLNNIYNFDMTAIKIKKSKGYYIITTAYEPRGTIVGKLDFIVSFKHEARVKIR